MRWGIDGCSYLYTLTILTNINQHEIFIIPLGLHACWIIRYISQIKFTRLNNISINCLINNMCSISSAIVTRINYDIILKFKFKLNLILKINLRDRKKQKQINYCS